MEVKKIITELESQIARLKEARTLLAGGGPGTKKRGRPAGTGKRGGKRRLSPEGRKRISEALKRRWAARRKSVAATARTAKAA